MFSKSKNWFAGGMWKPKNPHSVEHLKYLYSVLCKNQTIGEHNRGLLVETLRSISEILIWGDQNDSSVFDFFLEKNMLAFFLRYMRQKSGRYICVQLLQTLNILFENISNETSLYYLLSNNHINSIITHKFDFSDEEVMAYYISFLKTLSLKLNKHTIHFFYNEHTNDFALYTEAIKFFNHSESMVRIAVRTITLNVYKVDDKAMLGYIRDKTAAPYFTNLVWFIGIHILDLDACVRNDDDHQSRNRLADLVAEHLDHLHYMNDIFYISLDALNAVLTEHLLNRLFIPLYVYSLTKRKKIIPHDEKKHISSVVSLYLLSQVFLIISHKPLVRQLAEIIFQGDITRSTVSSGHGSPQLRLREFTAPRESLERTLENSRQQVVEEDRSATDLGDTSQAISTPSTDGASSPTSEVFTLDTDIPSPNQNSTDEEKLVSTLGIGHKVGPGSSQTQRQIAFSLDNRPYLEEVFNALECIENDYETLFALCLLYAVGNNAGIHQGLLDAVLMPTDRSETKEYYSVILVERLIKIITSASQPNNRVRLATLELCIKLLKQLVYKEGKSFLQDRHLACIENAREAATLTLRNFYKSEEIFLDMFEDEYREMKDRPLNVEYLTMDASIMLPPTGTPLTGIDFNKRLPCGEVERARKAIRAFFLIRDLSLTLLNEAETQLPLTREKDCIKLNDILDLNNSDLIACTISTRESRKQERRFLVIDAQQMILVEPDLRRLGWGVVRFVGYLQDVEVTGDKEDSRSLHITIHKPAGSVHATPSPHLSARFLFDDHIRCMAAKQRLTKGRHKSRQQKMQRIERLLEIPLQTDQGSHTPAGLYYGGRSGPLPGRIQALKVPVGKARHFVTSGTQARKVEQQQQLDRRVEVAAVQQVVTDNISQKRPVFARDDSNDGIEVAVEATSAVAFQTLNQQTSISPTNHRRDRSTSPIETNQVQEIPMEDLSRRSRKLSGPQDKRTSQLLVTQGHSRSHSLSPQRQRSSSSEKQHSSERNRSTSFTSQGTQTQLRSTTPVRKQHSKSLPLTKSTSGSTEASMSVESSTTTRDHKKEHSGKPPKTLRPAVAPALSLLPKDNSVMMTTKDTLKLLPPTDISQVQSLSDLSSSSSETDVSAASRKANDLPVKTVMEDFGSDLVKMDSNSVKPDNTLQKVSGKLSSTSAELKKLAQIVQEHYSYEEDDQA